MSLTWGSLLLLFGFLTCTGTEFRVSCVVSDATKVLLTFPTRRDCYYFLLHRTPKPNWVAVAACLGAKRPRGFLEPIRKEAAGFYSVVQFPLSGIEDYDKDCIPDGWELQHGLSPFLESDASELVPSESRTWLQKYLEELLPHAD